ncbi:MAG: MmgE/PrpD family protein [Desulfobacterales bacterium]|jgi:2-methylcitrate dehydratase PrpD
MDETIELTRRCRNITFEKLPIDVIDTAKHLFLDYLGITIRGSQTASAKCVQSMAGRFRSTAADMRIIGTDVLTDCLNAALANGIAAHSIECDDVVNEASLHPAVTIMTTALSAVNLSGRCSGKKFIEAIVSGYELVIRLGVAVDPARHYARGFHPTATCGTFGSAMTAACIFGLDEKQTVNALGIAGSQAAGSMEYLTDGVYTKRFHAGWASKSGLTAALLAREGFTGPQTIIEGKFGFLNGYSDDPHPERLFADWENPYKIMKTSIKPYACCRYKQGPIDCILQILQSHQLKPTDIKRIRVGVLSAGFSLVADPIQKKRQPQTIVDAQFSMPFGAAVAILFGNAGIDQYTMQNIHSMELLDLMARVDCYKDESLDALYPSKWPAEAIVETTDGKAFTSRIEYPKGDPENPLSWEAIQDKFLNMVSTVCSVNQANNIIECVENLEKIENVSNVLKDLKREP